MSSFCVFQIFLLLFLALIGLSWAFVRRYRKREKDDILVDDEEATVYRIRCVPLR